METAVTGRSALRVLVLLLLVESIQCKGWWNPIRIMRCPGVDTKSHECLQVTKTHMNCTEVVRNICSHKNQTIKTRMSINLYSRGPCYNNYLKTCIDYVCERKCCHGYYRNAKGKCAREFHTCFNGGTLLNKACVCPEGYAGDQCETELCDPPCQNGGVCSSLTGVRKCHCPSYLSGSYCETPTCAVKCMNGGTCVLNNTAAICLCPGGYMGPYCQHAQKVKQCMTSDVIQDINNRRYCRFDFDCSDGEHCCIFGEKGHVCARTKYTCTHKDGSVVNAGHVYNSIGSCQTCQCNPPVIANSTNGALQCATAGCSNPFLNHTNCCPVYGDQKHCGWPVITNCPKSGEILQVNVKSYNNIGCLDRAFWAEDCLRNPLDVILNRRCFRAGHTRYNYFTETAQTARDFNGNRGKCTLLIQLKDVTPPVFKSCPASVYAFTDEPAVWSSPVVVDNVGVRSIYLATTAFRNGSIFSVPGIYVLYYHAVDWQGNQQRCVFSVYAVKRDSSNIPIEMKSRESDSPGVIIAASVVGVMAIVLVLAVVIMFNVCRKRNRRLRRARHRSNVNENERSNVYSIYTNDPPPYDIAARDKLPEYTPKPRGSPPVYEDVARDETAGCSNQGCDETVTPNVQQNEMNSNSCIQTNL